MSDKNMSTVYVELNRHRQWEVTGLRADETVFGVRVFHESKAREAFAYANSLGELDTDRTSSEFREALEEAI